jgi:hypothetical protein
VCWKPCSTCWSFHLIREDFLSAPIHSPLSGSPYRSFILDCILSDSDEGPSSGKEEHASEGVAKWARGLPHICEHNCLAMTKRGRVLPCPTKVAPPSPSVGASTHTPNTLLTHSASLRVKGLTRGCFGWWTKAYKLAPPLLN